MRKRTEGRGLLERGRTLQAAEQWDDAARAFGEALLMDPELFEAAFEHGRTLMRLLRWTEAVDAFHKALSLTGDHPDALTGLADSLRFADCYDEALTIYDRGLQFRSDDAAICAGKAETLRLLGRSADSLVWYDRALQRDPENTFALRGKASALNALFRYADALPYWEDALKLQPASRFAAEGKDRAESGLLKLVTQPTAEFLQPPPPAPPLTGSALDARKKHAWGLALALGRRLDEAVEALQQAVIAAPTDVTYLWDLGEALDAAGRWSDAVAAYEDVLRLEPERVLAATRIGETLRKAGQHRRSIEAYDRALRLDPENVFALAGRGDALRLDGRHAEAIGWFDRALAVLPTHAFALRGKAACFAALHQYEAAVPVWRRALDLDPGVEVAQAGLRHAEAEVARLRRRPIDPPVSGELRLEVGFHRSDARVHFDLGRALVRQGRFAEAAKSFARATERDGDWAEAWYLLGVAHTEMGRLNEATEAFDRVLDVSPEHVDAACLRADTLRKMNQFEAAIRAHSAILDRAPDEVRALGGRAECFRLLGRFEEAAADFARTVALRPDNYFALCGQAASLNALQRYRDARPLWGRALALDPSSVFVKQGLAHCEAELQRTGGYSSAAPSRGNAPPPAAEPDRAAVLDILDRGRSFHKDHDYAKAIACFERAGRMDPESVDAFLRLGMAFEDDRQFRKAVDAYERCLALRPDHHQAATNIGECFRKNERYADAIKAYDRALTIRADYLYAVAGRAESMRMLGDYEGCLVWFDKALATGSKHAFAIQGKAAALNSLQRFGEALPLWAKALAVDPQSQFAKDGHTYCESQLQRVEAEEKSVAVEDAPESETPILDEQGRDLTALARAGKLGYIVGRDEEIRSVMKTLVRRQKANPLLLGDPGVGKTAVVEGVAHRLAGPDAPARLRHVRIIELSMGSLVAGTKYRGTFEERLKGIIKEAKSQPGIVLFIDEIHTLVGAGRTEGGSLDAANILKPALARGEITVIGATTLSEYRKHFESDSALDRRFQPVNVEEPSAEDTIGLLRKVQHLYAEHHKVRIQPAAIAACVHMSVRFIPDRRLPDKALDLIDETCAEASLSGAAVATEEMVAKVVAERTGIPVQKLSAEQRDRMVHMEDFLHERVMGQDDAVRRLSNAVKLSRAGLRAPGKPRGVFLFMGPSGVGKTELARALSDFLFPEGNALIKIDMSEFSEKHTVSKLIGAPPGYTGHGEEGQLTGPLRRRPYAVVLLDEFEKAHPDVQSMFLGLFDEGVVTDSQQRKVEAQEAFFIVTTNAGAESSSRSRVGFSGQVGPTARELALDRLRPYFRPELLNRLDDIVAFAPLGDEALAQIVEANLRLLKQRAADEGIELTWSSEVAARCATQHKDPKFGARSVLRAIDDLVAQPLGHRILAVEDAKGAKRFHASVRDDQIVVDVVLDELEPELETV